MPHITLITAGSRGDIQPYLALAVAFKQAGWQVLLSAPHNFADWIQSFDIDFLPIPLDVKALLEGQGGQQVMAQGKNPLVLFRTLCSSLEVTLEWVLNVATDAVKHTDVLLCHPLVLPMAELAAIPLNKPLVSAPVVPILSSRQHTSPLWPSRWSMGNWYNLATHHLMAFAFWQFMGPAVNRYRKKIGLKPHTWGSYWRLYNDVPTLAGYSSVVFPRPDDYPPHVVMTGYWYLDEPAWQPPIDLLAFLEQGSPPVYVGFGSMQGTSPTHTTQTVLSAVKQAGVRTVFATGWGGLQMVEPSDDIYLLESAPHSWLFPHMAAVIHHGGAGTTAAALRAGVPSVIVPHIADQFFWGDLLAKRGLAAAPVPHKQLNTECLASAIQQALTLTAHTKHIGERVAAEKGCEQVVNWFAAHFGTSHQMRYTAPQ